MKKTLSVILCAIMLLCCIPLTAGAYDRQYHYTASGTFSSAALESGTEYIINKGVTMTIPSNVSLALPTESMLRVQEGGKLVINGDLIIYGTGTLMVDGEITGGKKVSFNKDSTGDALVRISYPSLADAGLTGHVTSLAFYTADTPTADVTTDESWAEVDGSTFSADGGSFYAPLNSNFFVKVTFNEDEQFPKFDCNLFKVYLNNLGLAYNSGYYSTTLSASGTLDFSDWTSDADFYRTFKIQLPSGEGYEVVGRDYEVSSDGTVYLKYGTTFAFTVEVDEAYDMSDISVYVYNGYGFLNYPVESTSFDSLEMQPDQYGYYVISPVNSDCTVTVMGLVKNSTINLIGSIVETIRNVFNMIKEFFESFNLGGLFDGLSI